MIISAQLAGSQWYEVGDRIWPEPLADAIRAEADMIAGHANTQHLETAMKDALRDRIISEMTAALVCAGDIYQAPDGVVYTLHNDVESATRSFRQAGRHEQRARRSGRRAGPPVREPPPRSRRNPPSDRPMEQRQREHRGQLVPRRAPHLRRRSWELSAYVLSG
jgi:hypothetical protein